MIDCQKDVDPERFVFRLTPNHSLPRRASRLVLLAVAAAMLLTSTLAWAGGNVLAPVWACAELPVALALLAVAWRKTLAWEKVCVDAARIEILSSRPTGTAPHLPSAWTQVSSERGRDGHVHVLLHARETIVEVGTLLNDQDRAALAADLRALLRRLGGWRQAMPEPA